MPESECFIFPKITGEILKLKKLKSLNLSGNLAFERILNVFGRYCETLKSKNVKLFEMYFQTISNIFNISRFNVSQSANTFTNDSMSRFPLKFKDFSFLSFKISPVILGNIKVPLSDIEESLSF